MQQSFGFKSSKFKRETFSFQFCHLAIQSKNYDILLTKIYIIFPIFVFARKFATKKNQKKKIDYGNE